MGDVLLLTRELGIETVKLAVAGTLAAGTHDDRAVPLLACRRRIDTTHRRVGLAPAQFAATSSTTRDRRRGRADRPPLFTAYIRWMSGRHTLLCGERAPFSGAFEFKIS